jgi:2-polyprenyl-6-methoxyphenol hydroxylase-like FAD-dependent oxidoreductase
MEQSMTQVLIVGAGPTGIMLGIELLRRGVATRLVDAGKGPFEGSRGKGVQPRTLEIFDLIGVVDAMVASSTLYPFIKLHLGPFSKRLAPLGTRHSPTADRPYPNMLMVPQWRTNEILHDRFAELGGRIEYDSALLGIAQTEAVVTAELATGETIKADYLVGCDGGRSTVRGLLGVQLVGTSLDNKTMVVADLEIESLDREFWHAWPLNFGGMPSLCPLPLGNLFQLQSTSRIARSGLEAGVLRATGQRVTGIAWQSEFRHQTRMVDRYRVGRAFLAGDAAHLHPPSGAQGLNTSVQDAWNLGWKLAAAIRTGDDGLLETYQQERLPIAAAMLDLTGALHLRSSLKRGELTNHLSLGYRESTLNVGEADDGLAPGDRIPDRLLPDGSRLFDHLRHTGATQLIRRNAPHILIRPDAYVAEIGRREVGSYFGDAVHKVEID